jgi:cytochrome c553
MQTLLRVVRAVLVLIAVVFVCLVTYVYVASERRLNRKYDVAVTPLATLTDSASLARGKHLFHSTSCTLCHGEDGGGAIIQQSRLLGTIAGPNLTSGRGGTAGARSDEDWVRAIRRGVRHDGTSLIVMPSEVFTHLADSDLASMLGYLRQLPPVDREIPPSGFGPMGRALLAAGKLNILVAPKTPRLTPVSVPAGPTAEYGKYLADVSGCHGCHGYGLSGGRVAGPPGLPPASNLTPSGAIGAWTEADFARVLREGKRPGGVAVDEFMPWKTFRYMTDDEVHALWLYLKSVQPKEFGNK